MATATIRSGQSVHIEMKVKARTVRMEWIIFLLFSQYSAIYCGSHSLQYHITLVSAPTPGVPPYSIIMYVDGLRYGRYNSDIQCAQVLTPSLSVLSEHMEMQTRIAKEYEAGQRHRLFFLMGFFNKSKVNEDNHVYQMKSACEQHDDGTTDGYQEIAFDGKELLVFDKELVMFVPVTQEAVMVSHLWNRRYDATSSKSCVEIDCVEHLKLYLSYISTDLENKVPPNVKIASSESENGIKLHCWVYGFYPRVVEVKWIKNGRDEIYSEEALEILPNPDGTYQIRVSVEVTPEEGATYSCHVDHSSLEKILVVAFDSHNRSTLDIIIIILASAALSLLFFMIVLGLLIYRRTKGAKTSKSHQQKSVLPSKRQKLRNKYLSATALTIVK